MTLYITELFGSQNVTIPTLTRPWIVPDEIIISESLDSAYVHKATLKVMLEQDYLTGNRVQGIGYSQYEFKDPRLKVLNEYSSQLIRENIIPKLSKRINTSKDYAPLRQAYYSLILAQWFKARNANKNTQYSRLINKKDLSNLESKIPYSVNTYFNAYKDNFEKGEYNIQEPAYTPYGQVIRSYFSGGVVIFPETTPFHDALNQPIGTPSSTLLSRAPKEAMPNQHEIALEINGNTVTKPTAAAEKENSPKIEETPTSAPTAVTQDNGPTKNISPTGQLYIKGIISIAGVIIAISVGGHLGLGIALAAIAIDFFGKQIKLFFSGVAGLRGRSRSSPQKYPDSIVQHSRWGISGSGSIQIKDSNNVLRKLMVTQVKPPQITELALRLASRCIDPAHKELINSLLGIIADLPEQEKPRFYAYDAVIENSPYFYSSSKKVIALQKEILNDPKAGDIALAQSILEYLISANQLAISEGNGILIISFKEKRVFIRDDAKKNTAFIRNDSHLRTHILLQSLIGTLFFADDALENKTDEINQSSLERADFRARYMDSLALISLLGDFNSNQPPSAKAIQKEAARLRQQAHIHEALDETARDSASYPSRDSYVIEDTRAQKRLEEILTNILSKNGLPKSLLRIAILEGSSPNAFINPASPFTVFVHRGLLNNAHEDTIAWILAHEISHHIFYLKKILQNRWKLFKGGTSPGQEEHADILGLRMADRAGYNVSYAAQFFDLTPDHSPKEHNAPYQRKKNLQAYISQTAFRNKHKEPGFRFPESIPLRPVNPQPYARAGEFIESPEVNNLNVSMINTYERLKQNIAQLLNNRAENTPEAYREYCGTFLNLTAQARDLSDKDGFSFISREWAFHLYAIYTQMLRVSFPGSSQLHQQLFEAVAGLQQKNKEVYFNLGLVDRWFGLEASRYAEEYQKAQMPDFQVFAGGLKNNLPALIDRVKRRESYGKFGSAAHIFLSLPHQELIQQLGLEEYLQLILNYPVEATMGIREAGNEKIAAIATDQGISADERFNRLNRVYDIWQEYRNRTGYVLFYLNELVETCASKGVNGFDLVRIFPIEYCRSHNFYIFFSNFTEQQKQEILLFEINRSQPDASKINVVLRERPYLSAEFLTSYEGLVRAKDLAKNIKDWLLGAIFDARCQAEIYQDSYYYHSLTAGQRNYPNLPRGSPLPLNKLREIFGNDDRTVIEGIANLDFLDAHRKNAFLYAYYQQRVHELQGEERFLLLAMALNHFEFDQESSRGNKDSLAHDISWEITRQRGALMTPADTAEYSRQQGSFLDGKYYFVDFATDTPRTQPDLALIEQARQEGFIIWFESRIRQQSNPEAKLAAINSILTRASPLKDTFLEPLIEEILQQRNPDLTLALRIANLMRTPDLSVSYKLKVLDRKIGNIKQEGAAPQETRERILNSILEYFPQPSLIRDDILDSYIEDYVKALDEYRGLKTLYFSFSASDGRSIEGEAQDTVVDELTKQTNLAVYYLNKIPGYDQKVEFLLWVMGIRKVKPPVVQKLELMLKMNLDYLPQRFMQKEDYGNLRNIGKSVNQHIFHGLLWDKENGLATDAESGNTEGLWKNFTTALYENIIGKPEGMLYDIWETFFLLSPAKNWQITESALLNFLSSLRGDNLNGAIVSPEKRDELIAKFLQATGVIGIKLGQVLHSFGYVTGHLGDTLRGMKSALPVPYTKREFFRFLDYYNIQGISVNTLINEASVKAVFDAEKGKQRIAAKYKKPNVEEQLNDGFLLLSAISDALIKKGYQKVPAYLMRFLKEYLIREIDFPNEHGNSRLLKQKIKSTPGPLALINKLRLLAAYSGGWKNLWQALRKNKEKLHYQQIDTPTQELVNANLICEEFITSGGKIDTGEKEMLGNFFEAMLSRGIIHSDLHEDNFIVDKKKKLWILDTASIKTMRMQPILRLVSLWKALEDKDKDQAVKILLKFYPQFKKNTYPLQEAVSAALNEPTVFAALLYLTREISGYNYEFLELLKSFVSFSHSLTLGDVSGETPQTTSAADQADTGQTPQVKPAVELTDQELIETLKGMHAVTRKEEALKELLRRKESGTFKPPLGKPPTGQKVPIDILLPPPPGKPIIDILLPILVTKDNPVSLKTVALRILRLDLSQNRLSTESLSYNLANYLNDLRQELINNRLIFTVTPSQPQQQEYLAEVIFFLQGHAFDESEREQARQIALNNESYLPLRESCAFILANNDLTRAASLLDAFAPNTANLRLEILILKRFLDKDRSARRANDFLFENLGVYFDRKEDAKESFKLSPAYFTARLTNILEEKSINDPEFLDVFFSTLHRCLHQKFDLTDTAILFPTDLSRIIPRITNLISLIRGQSAFQAPAYDFLADYLQALAIPAWQIKNNLLQPQFDIAAFQEVTGQITSLLSAEKGMLNALIDADKNDFWLWSLAYYYLAVPEQGANRPEKEEFLSHCYNKEFWYFLKFLVLDDPGLTEKTAKLIANDLAEALNKIKSHSKLSSDDFYRINSTLDWGIALFIELTAYINEASLRARFGPQVFPGSRAHDKSWQYWWHESSSFEYRQQAIALTDLTQNKPYFIQTLNHAVKGLLEAIVKDEQFDYAQKYTLFVTLLKLVGFVEKIDGTLAQRYKNIIRAGLQGEKNIKGNIRLQHHFYDSLFRFLKETEPLPAAAEDTIGVTPAGTVPPSGATAGSGEAVSISKAQDVKQGGSAVGLSANPANSAGATSLSMDDSAADTSFRPSSSLETPDGRLGSIPQAQKAPGGIDFRFLPIVTQSMDNLKANIKNILQSSLQRINLTQEWSDIERLVNAGIIPSAERLKDYLVASCLKGELDRDMNKIVSCISDILRTEEERCFSADPALKDMLVVLESGRSGEELKIAFSG